MPNELIWPARPVLSLIKHFTEEGSIDGYKRLHPIENGFPVVEETDEPNVPAVWHGSATETFSASLSNVLRLRVRFKAKDAYGAQARFLVMIDRSVGPKSASSWQREVWDPVCFCTPPGDHNNWYYYEREYTLAKDISLISVRQKKDTELKFKITGYVWIGGALPSSGEGSSGHYGDPHPREFTAILKPPALKLVKEELAEMQLREAAYARQLIERLDVRP